MLPFFVYYMIKVEVDNMFSFLSTTSKKMALSSILALVVNFLGETAPLIVSVFYLVVIDVTLGLICAKWYRKESITTRRFVKKVREVGLFAIGLAAFIISKNAFVAFGMAQYMGAKFFACAYIFYELFSILENLGEMGFPIAHQIKNALKAKLPKELQEENHDKTK